MEQTTEFLLSSNKIDHSTQSVAERATLVEQREATPLPSSLQSQNTSTGMDSKLFSSIIAKVPIILFVIDDNGIFLFSEGQELQHLGLVAEQMIGRSIFAIYEDFPQTIEYVHRALAGEDLVGIDRIGDLIFETQFTPLRDATGHVSTVIGVCRDISDRVQAEKALQSREQRFQSLIEQTTDLILILDAIGMYRFASPSHLRILGYAPEDLVGTNILGLIHPVDLPNTFPALVGAFQERNSIISFEVRMRHANGSWVILECTGRNCLDNWAIEGLVIDAHDITERKAMEEQLRRSASYDALTNLPNRISLQEAMAQAITLAGHAKSTFALIIVGLNRFKEINNMFGHESGDVLLQQIGLRLSQEVSTTEMVARLEGDEFAILLPGADRDYTQQIIETVDEALKKPLNVGEYSIYVEVSIGAVLYPEHGLDSLTLLRHADIAMYMAREIHTSAAFYETQHDQSIGLRLALAGALPQAITGNELQLYYQPKVDVETMQVQDVEALIRWISPVHGFISPDQFISLAEQTGSIHALTQWVLETAIQQCRTWLQAGLGIAIAVNISVWNLRDALLPEKISALLTRYDVPPHLLSIEVTESAVMTDMEKAIDVLRRIADLGIAISVDDFGTGYSSLAYLKRLPVNALKIDQSFVRNMTANEADTIIVQSTIQLAHNLGLKVVAEGVEDQLALDLLRTYGCDTVQGYFFSRPTPSRDFEKWVWNWQQKALLSEAEGRDLPS